VGGELCAKHHCFTRASCNSDEGSSVISGDIGAVGDDRLCFGVDDEENLTEQQGESRPFEFGTTTNNNPSLMNGQPNPSSQPGQFQF